MILKVFSNLNNSMITTESHCQEEHLSTHKQQKPDNDPVDLSFNMPTSSLS